MRCWYRRHCALAWRLPLSPLRRSCPRGAAGSAGSGGGRCCHRHGRNLWCPDPGGNLTLVDDYHTDYSDGSGQQFITLVSKSGATFYLVIDRNAKGQQTVHFMNLVDEADLLALMEEDAADAYTAEKEAAAQAEQDKLKAEEEAKKAAEEAAASGEEQPKENKVTKIASGFLGVVVLIALAAGGGFYAFTKQKQKKQAEKEALDPDANYTEDKGDFEIPVEDEPEETSEENNTEV